MHFLTPSSKSKKKNPPLKNFLIFQEIELSGSNTRKICLYFRKCKHPKKFLIFQETKVSYISRKGNPKKLPIFQEMVLSNGNGPSLKKWSNFGKWSKLKKILIFLEEFQNTKNQNLSHFSKKKYINFSKNTF